MPADRGATLDVTPTVAGVVPLAGETVSHEPPEATAVNDVFGVAEMLRLCAPGELPPTVAENESDVGFTNNVCVVELTVSVTATDVFPELLLMVTVPLYVPAASCAGRTATVSVCGVVRLPLGETDSHVTPPLDPEALTENRTDLDAVTEIVCCCVAVLPAVALNESDAGETDRRVPPRSA